VTPSIWLITLIWTHAHLDHPATIDDVGWGQRPDWETERLYRAQ
jgi:hypothetical protein